MLMKNILYILAVILKWYVDINQYQNMSYPCGRNNLQYGIDSFDGEN